MVRVGESAIEYISLLDGANPPAPVLGATFSVVTSRDPFGAPIVLPDPWYTDVGGGAYRITVGPFTAAGDWYLLFESDDATHQPFEGEWQVDPAADAGLTSAGITRAELRRLVGQQTGDLLLATATAAGTTSQAISSTSFTVEANALAGRQVLFTGGTTANLGQLRIVQGSDPTTRSITLTDPLPAAVMPGDTLELYNQRGMGWTVEEVDEAINAAIRLAGDLHATVPVVVSDSAPFSRSAPELAIPDTFSHFEGLDYLDRLGVRRTIPAREWSVDRGSRTVTVRGRSLTDAQGQTLRFRGHARPATLTADSDRTTIPTDWLVTQAVALLMGQDVAAGYGTQGRAQLYAAGTRAADGKRPIVITRYGPNCVRLH